MFRWLKKDRRTAAAAAAAGAGADGEKRATQPPPGNVSSSDGSDDIRRRKSAFSYDGNLSEFDSDDMESSTAALATDEELSGVVIGGSRGRASTRTRGDDLDMEGLTLITVDDGKGGLKHVKVAKPPEGQEDSVVVTPVDENGGVGGKAGKASGGGGGSRSGSGSGSGSALTKKPSLGDMLRKEFKVDRSLFSDMNALQLRICNNDCRVGRCSNWRGRNCASASCPRRALSTSGSTTWRRRRSGASSPTSSTRCWT